VAATEVLNGIDFGLGMLSEREAVALSGLLRRIRQAAGDFGPEAADPWASATG